MLAHTKITKAAAGHGLMVLMLGLITCNVSNELLAQSSQQPDRAVTVTLGLGNSMGWLGGQGEYYLAAGRVSLFAGLGYTPDWDYNRSGLALAGGVRGYSAGSNHRVFVEASVSQVAVQRGGPLSPGTESYYGPALLLGYQFVSAGGFTAVGSAGAGYILDGASLAGDSRLQAVLNLGLGYTWR